MGVSCFSLIWYFASLKAFNNIKLPIRKYCLKAAAMIPSTILIWTPIAAAVLCTVDHYIPISDTYYTGIAFLLGLILPATILLTYIPINPVDKGKLTDVLMTPLNCLTVIREATVGYVGKIVKRQARKEIQKYILTDSNYISKVFEYHLIEIAESRNRSDGIGNPTDVFYVNDIDVKNWYILEYLGYKRFMFLLKGVKQNGNIIFPSWPIDTNDRRLARADRRISDKAASINTGLKVRSLIWGRRKTDMPYSYFFVNKSL